MMLKLLSYLTPLAAIALIIYSLNSPKTVSQSQVSGLPTCDVKPGLVYDGDTLRVYCDGVESKIRFSCIDAPEIKQDKGIASRDHLRMLLNQAGNQVKVNAVDTDRYGRTVADLYTNDGLIQLQQVKAGWVWANSKYKSDCADWEAIAAAEKDARVARQGIWNSSNPMPPWEWRKRNR